MMLDYSMSLMPAKSNGSRLSHLHIVAPTVSKRSHTVQAMSSVTSSGDGQGVMCSPCCMSRDDLKKKLSPLQYQITQEKGTERAFTGKFYKLKDDGMYSCVVCGEELFSSQTKYESGSGWPAFFDVIDKKKVKLKQDLSHVGGNILLIAMKPGLVRTEVSCAKCQAHLGHLFDDGPKPSGKRFCINSAALNFTAVQLPDDRQPVTPDTAAKYCNGNSQNGL